jgi:spermidine/putrescine-binding protein
MMINEGMLQELDGTKIPNIGNVAPAYLDQQYDPGSKYSVPYLGGLVALAVNKAMVDEEITSFAQLFDPKYANSVVALDDFRILIGMTAKTLGYSFNTTDDAELAEIEKKLMELKPNIKQLDSDSPKTAMLSRETSLGLIWSGEIAMCIDESDDFEVVFQSEGCYIFIDNFCILDGAKNTAAAYDFINFVLRPDISKLVCDEFPYLNPNAAVIDLLPDSYKNNPASNIDPKYVSEADFVLDIGADVQKYNDLWTKFVQ